MDMMDKKVTYEKIEILLKSSRDGIGTTKVEIDNCKYEIINTNLILTTYLGLIETHKIYNMDNIDSFRTIKYSNI
jgi:hypothetical protein